MRALRLRLAQGRAHQRGLARDVLSDVIPPPGYKPTIERIQEAVAAHYGLTVAKLTSASREQKIALPRQVAMFLCRELAKETFQLIAEKFNKKDHTTVIAAKERVEELLGQDPEVQARGRHPDAEAGPVSRTGPWMAAWITPGSARGRRVATR